uniref:Uncharacterized protein n=1 Tax=viral metagenome TaxID=1070528 RepID=A0A6C0KPT6_9ZZZZ
MLLLLLLLFVFLLTILYIGYQKKEGFENEPLDSAFLQTYQSFAAFYNSFLTTWEKAIVTSVSLDVSREPLQSPTQTPSGTPPTVSRLEQNNYISKLSNQLNMPLPFMTDPLPSSVDRMSIPTLLKIIPTNTTPYQNAFDWMNKQLQLSQQNLSSSLHGMPPTMESFVNSCGDVSQCILNDPVLISKVSDEINSKDSQKEQQQQNELVNRMNAFTKNSELQQAAKTNQVFVQQSEEIKKQAESGELYKKVNVSDRAVPVAPMPSGGLDLSIMKQSDPQQYNQLKDNYSKLFSLKQTLEQVNQNI